MILQFKINEYASTPVFFTFMHIKRDNIKMEINKTDCVSVGMTYVLRTESKV